MHALQAAVETAAGDDAAVEKPNGEAAELMDALCLRARSHLMNRHSSKATFAPQVPPCLIKGWFAVFEPTPPFM